MSELLWSYLKFHFKFQKRRNLTKKMSELLFIISEISLPVSEDDWLISSLLGSNISFLSNNWSFFLFKWFCLSQYLKGQVFLCWYICKSQFCFFLFISRKRSLFKVQTFYWQNLVTLLSFIATSMWVWSTIC